MTNILANSAAEAETLKELAAREVPSYRQAYSDRTCWVMSCLAELAYVKYNPFKPDIKRLEKTLLPVLSDKHRQWVIALLSGMDYDHEVNKKTLDDELSLLGYHIVETFDNDGTQAFLAENDKNVVLAFRGTEAASIKDIKADAKAVTQSCESGGKIHSGFDEAYQKVAFDIEKALAADGVSDKPLFITGHSLGGALATIAAKKITHKGGNAACYTFGAPRVADEEWISAIKTPLYRIVNAADCVTMLPPGDELVTIFGGILGLIPSVGKGFKKWLLSKFGGYLHGGNMRYLTNCSKNDYANVKLLYSVSGFYRAKMFLIKRFSWRKPLADHSISIYRKKLMIVARKRNGLG